jgi:Leucine-rich repeat (LRR) protein
LNKLIYLDLSQNKIQKIPNIGFEALQELNFSKNSIEDLDEFVRSEDLVNLKKLILSYNSLSTLPMMNFECLEYLDLATNKIVYLDEFLSSNLPTLLSLDLRKN